MRTLIILSSLLVGSLAWAGDQLLFKSGTLDTDSQQSTNQILRDSKGIETHFYVVQFKNRIQVEDQKLLESRNLKIVRYLPDDAYIVKAESKNLRGLNSSPSVQTVLPYAPQFKMNMEAHPLSVFNSRHAEKLFVRVFDGENLESIASELTKLSGVQILETGRSNFLIQAPMSVFESIGKIDGVEWVDIYREKKLMKLRGADFLREMQKAQMPEDPASMSVDELTGYESGTRIMKFEMAWKAGFTGQGQIVTVADTGLDTGDKGTLTSDFSNLHKPFIGGYKSKSWADPDGHGTHVSGSVLGLGTHSGGKLTGGAYGAKLIMESLWSAEVSNITIPSDFSSIFAAAYKEGSRIHTNSWGDPEVMGIYDETAELVDRFVWEHPDMLILFAAGNDGIDANKDGRVDAGSVSAPATAKNIISVGASENLVSVGGIQFELGQAGTEESGMRWPVEPLASDKFSNNENGIAAFSSRGPTRDGRLKPEVVAPGTNILSTCSQFTGSSELWGRFNDNYCYCGGTSMSTPLVAGAAAVVRQYLVSSRKIKNPSAALVKAVIMHSADDLYPGQYGEIGKEHGQELLAPGPNSDQGYGRVNVTNAVSDQLQLIDEDAGVETGGSKSFDFPDGVKKVTLVYTDAPGSPASAKALVNDLDLEVHVGDRFYSSNSRINNSEQIVISTRGAMKVVVKGVNIPVGRSGKLPFALVIQ